MCPVSDYYVQVALPLWSELTVLSTFTPAIWFSVRVYSPVKAENTQLQETEWTEDRQTY